jgi:hypothetical protein
MSDPLAQPPDRSPLFDLPAVGGTRAAAGVVAAMKSGSRRRRILQIIERQPSTLFEIAAMMGVGDNVISGRLTELQRDGFIERTGQTRVKPESGCPCDVYRIARALPAQDGGEGWAELLGYPATLMIQAEPFDRQAELPGEGYPGVHYARQTDSGAMRRSARVEIVESPSCGRPLYMESGADGSKKFRCTNPGCLKAWRARGVNEPGKSAMLALVMEEF